MSINKILNRPIFRKEALKKGHLKPITAQTGIMVGQPYTPPPPPAVRPGMFKRGLRAIGTPAFGFGYGLTDSTLSGVAPNMNPYAREAINVGAGLGLNSLALRYAPAALSSGFLPATLALGIGYGTGELVKAGIKERKRIKAMSPKEYEAFKNEQEAKAFSYFGDGLSDSDLFGDFKPEVVDEISKKKPPTTIPNPGSGRPGSKFYKQKETDIATEPDNVTKFGKEKKIDTAKIAENAVEANSGRAGDTASAVAREKTLPQPEAPKVEGAPTIDNQDDAPKGKGEPDKATIGAGSALKLQLDEAQKMVEDMRKGKGSNANLVFLTNLASGLLTGKTNKSGIGGAMEVFGAALGPATNNMIMVKMKEDEIRDNLLGRVLDFQSDFLKAQNEAYVMPDTDQVGVIQMTNKEDRIVNVPGRILKDGTKQIATGRVDQNGVNIYQTVDPSLNFINNDDANKNTLELAEGIAGKYAAVNLINRSLGIIEAGGADAGVTGAIGLYGGRITEALGDVFSFAKIGGDSEREVRAAGKAAFEIEKNKAAIALVASGEFEDQQSAMKYLNTSLGTFEKNRRSALSNAKKRLEGGNSLDYERLAINETVLVYKLANSLKAKDRLTQKDIEMAKGLVKVFPLLRGERNVIASLTATAETILDDIKQQERLYERAGGSSQYLLNERKAYGLLPEGMTLDTMRDFESNKFDELRKKVEEMTEEDFDRMFPNL
jgi:hypothetical protein